MPWLFALLLAPASLTALAADFLRLDGIAGGASPPTYTGWIEITSFHQSVAHPDPNRVDVAGPLGALASPWRDRIRLLAPGAVRPEFGELVVMKIADKASPVLALACAAGTPIRTARLELLRRDAGGVLLARVDLENVAVRRFSASAAGGDSPVSELLALGFDDIKFTVIGLDVRGVPSTQHTAHWDVLKGTGEVTSAPYSGGGGGTDPQALLARNLLANPDAEASAGAADLLTALPPLGWQTTGGFTALRYSAGGFDDSTAGPSDRQLNLFAGGPGDAVSLARQLIDVAAAAPLIDAWGLKAILDGWLGGVGAEEDDAELTAGFLGADGRLLGEAGLGPVSARDRGAQTALLFDRRESLVPPGTRMVEVTLKMTRYSGTYNDGIADSLGLTLIEGPAGPSRLPMRVLLVRDAPSGDNPRLQCSWPAAIANVTIEYANNLADGWTPANADVRVVGEERVCDLPVDPAAPARFWRLQAR